MMKRREHGYFGGRKLTVKSGPTTNLGKFPAWGVGVGGGVQAER